MVVWLAYFVSYCQETVRFGLRTRAQELVYCISEGSSTCSDQIPDFSNAYSLAGCLSPLPRENYEFADRKDVLLHPGHLLFGIWIRLLGSAERRTGGRRDIMKNVNHHAISNSWKLPKKSFRLPNRFAKKKPIQSLVATVQSHILLNLC